MAFPDFMTHSPLPIETIRARQPSDGHAARPIYAVWEVTLRCDQPCQHCGSRAGAARDDELDTQACIQIAQDLGRLGCREVVLIGGEAYLRPDIEIIISALRDAKIRPVMQSGGRGLVKGDRLERLKAAGLMQIGISIDGPREVHDKLRGNAGSYDAALLAMRAAKKAGIAVSANTQINRLNYQELRPFAQTLIEHGAESWQLTLTVPMGRAADNPQWLLPPSQVMRVIDDLATIQLESAKRAKEGGPVFDVVASNTVGYFGPYESTLRSRPGGTEAVWGGCVAGQNAIGIESDGTVKGCPSLPTGPYAGGNLKTQSLEKIWTTAPELAFNRAGSEHQLWGRCAECYYATHCRGGCSWMAHTTLGRRGNNPFCYHRVETLAKQGLRERLVPKARAPNRPFDFGRFTLEEVPLETPEHEDPVHAPLSSRVHLPVLDARAAMR